MSTKDGYIDMENTSTYVQNNGKQLNRPLSLMESTFTYGNTILTILSKVVIEEFS
jgi:hypothetical protein